MPQGTAVARQRRMTSTIIRHIDLQKPATDAYAQWTQFAELPRIMERVQKVEQIDDSHLNWTIEIAGLKRQWTTEITEQIPDKRIAWTGVGDTKNAGCVTFHRLSDDSSRILLQMEFEPEGLLENAADRLDMVGRAVGRELDNFRQFLEARDGPTGRWDGTIAAPDERGSKSSGGTKSSSGSSKSSSKNTGGSGKSKGSSQGSGSS
jgi:uncharacterized membrane protein